jgi:type I restriction enzyme S subunit
MNWNFISNEGLGGREAESDTYQLAISNMLISSGHMFNVLEKDDTIRNPITNKYDIVLANPPFGMDGLVYNEISHSLRNEYMPIKSSNAVSLFLQAIIYMLKINGRCAVVLPNGKELFNKGNELVAIREYLMKTCDLKEIYYLPSGTFTHTPIKTCVFYFVKKREGTDVLETKIKVSKTQKETGRNYKFSKTHQTTKVKFYDYNPYEDIKKLLVEVPIEKIVSNSYSLNYTEYIKNETEKQYEEVVVKTLGEVCNFQNGYSFKSTDYEKQNETNIGIVQIKSIQNGYIDENKITEYIEENKKYKLFEIQKGDILIALSGATTGKIGIYNLEQKSYLNQRVGKLNAKSGISQKYIYYWYVCCSIDEKISNLAQGTAQPNISTNDISNIEIPIPTLEHQKEIVKYLDFVYEKANKTSNEKIENLKLLNEFCLSNQKIFGVNVVKKLGEITTYKSGKRLPQGHLLQNNKTPYPYIRITDIDKNSISLDNIKYISQETKDIINKYIITTNDIYITIAGTTGLVGIIPNELDGANLTENAVRINIVNKNEILQKYLVYDIHYNQQEEFKTKSIGTAIPKLSIERLMTLQIPIPSLERQKEIVEYCEYNDTLIKQLENEIENNKKQAQQFITSILKTQVKSLDENTSKHDSANNFQNFNILTETNEVDINIKKITKRLKKIIIDDDNEI